MTGPSFRCSCGWETPDPGTDAFVCRLAVRVKVEEAVGHWELGHAVSCRPDLREIVERAAFALAARRRGISFA